MSTKDEAILRKVVEKAYPGATAKEVVSYGDDYTFIVRVEHPEASERDFDPFFKVDIKAQTVEDFSIIHDAEDPAALMAAFANAANA